MTISREQVADLQPGDVVEMRWDCYPDVTVSGPLYPRGGGQWVGPVPVIRPTGELHNEITLTVVSRAPRPLYVNHPRTEQRPGDVVRDADDERRPAVWTSDSCDGWWLASRGVMVEKSRAQLPARLRLLVDGETGQVVP